jgi:hypothetical protein
VHPVARRFTGMLTASVFALESFIFNMHNTIHLIFFIIAVENTGWALRSTDTGKIGKIT